MGLALHIPFENLNESGSKGMTIITFSSRRTWHEIEKFVMSVKCQNSKSTGEIFLAKVMLKGKSGEAESIKCVYLPLPYVCKV